MGASVASSSKSIPPNNSQSALARAHAPGTLFYAGTVPLQPMVIQHLWTASAHNMYTFLELYKQMLELQSMHEDRKNNH
jgi:hypothetical protein